VEPGEYFINLLNKVKFSPWKVALMLPLLRCKPMNAESLVASSSRLDVLHQGLDDDLVMLKERPAKGGAP